MNLQKKLGKSEASNDKDLSLMAFDKNGCFENF